MVWPGQERVDDLGRAAARVGGRIAAAVEQQGTTGAGGAEPGDPAGDQVVVAGLVDRFDGALDPGQRAVQHRGAAGRGRPGHPGELVAAAGAEPPGQVLLSVAEDVDAEVPGALDGRPGG